MFLLDDTQFATLHTLPFLVGLALPGWRSLIITSCAALAFATYANATAGGGLASLFGLLFIFTAVGAHAADCSRAQRRR
ncbi:MULTISPECIES: hypothetical protein [unclassified Bradyrhizobium]|uniref:hypothetical protein n=1 Tax=unclassified Bradyrhizobium TaxID=2631580 RepID=UPI00247A7A26|nr:MULTISPECIES: hypothetical protein [unclassified Bradyrhizobium]WGS21493.1 hypothetical protein MTX22_07165 [Bradyrhizobium sp. ISRA463]WGS28430.1 hypothetical protein MTX19_05010 [Bradyrhizobium sp. ISRA464]